MVWGGFFVLLFQDAENALKAKNGEIIGGRSIRLNWAAPKNHSRSDRMRRGGMELSSQVPLILCDITLAILERKEGRECLSSPPPHPLHPYCVWLPHFC